MSEQHAEIALCHQLFLRAGGMEHYAIGLAKAFREMGCRMTVYARQADSDLAGELGVNLVLSGQRTFRQLRDWQFQRFIEASLPSIRGLQIGLSRVPVRHLSVCGGTHKAYMRALRKVPGPFDYLKVRLERRAYEKAHSVISHSNLCSGELTSLYGLHPRKILTIYPPVSARFAPGDKQAARRVLNLPPDKPILLFPSMGHRRKGLEEICQAIEGLPGAKPLLAVAGKPVRSRERGFVLPLGYIESMETAYRAADFTVLGSRYEPFGLVGPESVLCGTPLLFEEKIGCLPAIDRRAVTLFNVQDPASVRAALQRALELYQSGAHALKTPVRHLNYNPDPVEHARLLLDAGRAAQRAENR